MAREKSNLRRTTVFVFDDQWEELRSVAREKRIPVSQVLREAITQFLKNWSRESHSDQG